MAFYFWDSYMEYTKRKHYIQEGIRYNILFYENTNNVMGNVYLFYNIKSSKDMKFQSNMNNFTCVLNGRIREYHQIKGLSNTPNWIRMSRSPWHLKYENVDQEYRIELVDSRNRNQSWILLVQFKRMDIFSYFHEPSERNFENNYFEIDEDYNADDEDNAEKDHDFVKAEVEEKNNVDKVIEVKENNENE